MDFFIVEFIPPLLKVITDTSAKELENLSATENAIAAIVRICVYRPNLIDMNTILSQFLNWLPITEDELEAPHIYDFLCNLVERFAKRLKDILQIIILLVKRVFFLDLQQ